jgi:hypothetical protein
MGAGAHRLDRAPDSLTGRSRISFADPGDIRECLASGVNCP